MRGGGSGGRGRGWVVVVVSVMVDGVEGIDGGAIIRTMVMVVVVIPAMVMTMVPAAFTPVAMMPAAMLRAVMMVTSMSGGAVVHSLQVREFEDLFNIQHFFACNDDAYGIRDNAVLSHQFMQVRYIMFA
jgi:hypothetical protein